MYFCCSWYNYHIPLASLYTSSQQRRATLAYSTLRDVIAYSMYYWSARRVNQWYRFAWFEATLYWEGQALVALARSNRDQSIRDRPCRISSWNPRLNLKKNENWKFRLCCTIWTGLGVFREKLYFILNQFPMGSNLKGSIWGSFWTIGIPELSLDQESCKVRGITGYLKIKN